MKSIMEQAMEHWGLDELPGVVLGINGKSLVCLQEKLCTFNRVELICIGVSFLFVAPEHRGKHLASATLNAAIDFAAGKPLIAFVRPNKLGCYTGWTIINCRNEKLVLGYGLGDLDVHFFTTEENETW